MTRNTFLYNVGLDSNECSTMTDEECGYVGINMYIYIYIYIYIHIYTSVYIYIIYYK